MHSKFSISVLSGANEAKVFDDIKFRRLKFVESLKEIYSNTDLQKVSVYLLKKNENINKKNKKHEP